MIEVGAERHVEFLSDPMHGVEFLTTLYPNIWKILEPVISDRFQLNMENVSRECFLPITAYRDLIQHHIENGKWELGVHKTISSAVFAMAVMCPFKYTRHIYEFTDLLSIELLKTEFNEKLPYEVFDRFPNYGICIKCHECLIYCSIVDFESKDERILIFSYFTDHTGIDDDYPTHRINCVATRICKNRTLNEIFSDLGSDQNTELQKQLAKKYINLVLYICSENPDIIEQNKDIKTVQFDKPKPHWHHGFKLLPAKKDKVFILGQSITKQLQELNSGHIGSKVRPHIRRAHWHGYWTGHKRTEFTLKWIAPTLIATNNGYQEQLRA